jgi:hypothetical protein
MRVSWREEEENQYIELTFPLSIKLEELYGGQISGLTLSLLFLISSFP